MSIAEKLDQLYKRTTKMYQDWMYVSNELAEMLKTIKGLSDTELVQRDAERQKELAIKETAMPAEGNNSGDLELEIF